MTEVLGITLPPTWSSSKLKGVTSFLGRGSAPDYADNGLVRAVGQAANQDGGFNWSRTRFHNYLGDPTKLKGYLRPEDVLVNSTGTGTLGRVGFFIEPPDELPCMADGHVSIVRLLPERAHPRFVYYWMRSRPFQEYIYAALVVGATNQVELNGERLADAPIPLPSITDQVRISNYLDNEVAEIDSCRSLYGRLANVVREKQSAITEYLVLRGVSGSASPSYATAAPSIPTRFRLGRLRNVAKRIDVGIAEAATHAYVDSGVPLIRSTNIRPNRLLDHDLLFIAPWFAQRNRSKFIHAHDILTVRTGSPGVSAVVPPSLDQSQTFTQLITTIVDGHLPEYFCFFLNTQACRRYFEASCWGSAQKNISVPILANTPVPIPDPAEQRRIVAGIREVSTTFEQLASKADRQQELLAERRDALITAAVTGRMDISTASVRGVED